MTARSVSQLMFLQPDGRLTPMSIAEAESGGYGVTLTANRAVLRASYKAAEAQLIQVGRSPGTRSGGSSEPTSLNDKCLRNIESGSQMRLTRCPLRQTVQDEIARLTLAQLPGSC